MAKTPHASGLRVASLRMELTEQGRRVQAMLEGCFEAVFAKDPARASRIISMDDEIDRVDVDLERACVQLLTDATHENARLEPDQLRAVLTIVKINNELERIADCGVTVAERARGLRDIPGTIPETFRVMANSVVGIMRDTCTAYSRSDATLAKVVLQSEDCIEAFKVAILKDAESRIAQGSMHVDFAFTLHEIANECCSMADHCTNIAEQIIYSLTGAIVRHMEGRWVEVPRSA